MTRQEISESNRRARINRKRRDEWRAKVERVMNAVQFIVSLVSGLALVAVVVWRWVSD